jgi:hypothetical protein
VTALASRNRARNPRPMGEGFIFWTAAPCVTRSTFRSTCGLLLVPLVYSLHLYVVASLSSAAMPSLVSLL